MFGRGLLIRETSAEVRENRIVGNRVNSFGENDAAVFIYHCSGIRLLEDNVIFGNAMSGGSAVAVMGRGAVRATSNYLTNEPCQYEVEAVGADEYSLDLAENWWGVTDSTLIETRIGDSVDDPGIGGCVDFSGWCADSSCSGTVATVPEAEPTAWGAIKRLYR